MKAWWLAILLLTANAHQLLADEYLQQYMRGSDRKVLYELRAGRETVKVDEKGDARKTNDGVEYIEVVYRVYLLKPGGQQEKVNEQLVWLFPNDAQGNDDTRSNRWIYWCKPLEGGKGRIWGRCPTPKHPHYEGWKQAKGLDLWQVVPVEQRAKVPADADPDEAVKLMAKNGDGTPMVIGEKEDDIPRVVPRDRDRNADTITCVRFENFI
ncbi:hypothetical protein BH10PLA2_BH10PLA2_37040 [soil metagenome]